MSDSVIPYPIRGSTPYIVGPMGQPGVYEYTIISGESLKDYSYGNSPAGSSPVNMYAAEIYGFYMASPISQNGYIFFNEDLIMVTYSYGLSGQLRICVQCEP